MKTEIEKCIRFFGFKSNTIYRVSKIIDNRDIAGKPVIFHEFVKYGIDNVRARVTIVGSGEEWLVHPSYIIKVA